MTEEIFQMYDSKLLEYLNDRNNTKLEKELKKVNRLFANDLEIAQQLMEIHSHYYFLNSEPDDILYLLDLYAKIDALIPENVISDIIIRFDELVYHASQSKRLRSKAVKYFDKILNKAVEYYLVFFLTYLRKNVIVLENLELLDPEFMQFMEEYAELYPYPQGLVGAALKGIRPSDKSLTMYTNYILRLYKQ